MCLFNFSHAADSFGTTAADYIACVSPWAFVLLRVGRDAMCTLPALAFRIDEHAAVSLERQRVLAHYVCSRNKYGYW